MWGFQPEDAGLEAWCGREDSMLSRSLGGIVQPGSGHGKLACQFGKLAIPRSRHWPALARHKPSVPCRSQIGLTLVLVISLVCRIVYFQRLPL